jgi:hypothetical protein
MISPHEEIQFEIKDAEIFKILDLKTRLDTLQNYFFPRFDRLLLDTVDLVQEIYKLDPFEDMTIIRTPSHRKDAKKNIDTVICATGLAPKRYIHEYAFRDDGSRHKVGPSQLKFEITPSGNLDVEMIFFGWAGRDFRQKVAKSIRDHWDLFIPVLEWGRIAASVGNDDWTTLHSSLDSSSVIWSSPQIHFPVSGSRLFGSQLSFILLYPMLDTTTRLARNEDSRLVELLESFKKWLAEPEQCASEEGSEDNAKIAILDVCDDIESYNVIRPGLWWDILKRDLWTCRSCGRSANKDGVCLEIDHILPRSKGGSNDSSNLQVLCKKCNSGKSNRDNTNLREL